MGDPNNNISGVRSDAALRTKMPVNTQKNNLPKSKNPQDKSRRHTPNPSQSILDSNTRTQKSRVLSRNTVKKGNSDASKLRTSELLSKFPKSTPNPFQSILAGSTRTQRSNVLARSFVKKTTPAHEPTHRAAPNLQRNLEHTKTLMRKVVRAPIVQRDPELAPEPTRITTPTHPVQTITDGLSNPIPLKRSTLNNPMELYGSNYAKRINDFVMPVRKMQKDSVQPQTSANAQVHIKNLEKLAQIEDSPLDDSDIFAAVASKLSDTPKVVLRRNRPKFYHRIAKKLDIALTTLIIGVIGLIVGAGIIASLFLFSTNIDLFAAEFKTGVKTNLPNYTPSGYKLGSIKSVKNGSQDAISFTYHAVSGANLYAITANKSSLDSQGLISTVLQPSVGSDYKTYQAGGRTVYFFANYIVWVSGGVYYQIYNQTNLSNSLLLQIVEGT